MNKEKLSKELERVYIEEGILLERTDVVSNATFCIPNMSRIKMMAREFDFLVDGSSRGRAINKISKIELDLFNNENQPDVKNNILASEYSNASIFLEKNRQLLEDKKSGNWINIFSQYFSLDDIYNYFHKTEGASGFFRKFQIYHEIVELEYYVNLMGYLKDQIDITLAVHDEYENKYRIDSLEFAILILKKLGFLDSLKSKMKDQYYDSGSRFITMILGKPSGQWRKTNEILHEMDQNTGDERILSDNMFEEGLRDILYHYKLDLR